MLWATVILAGSACSTGLFAFIPCFLRSFALSLAGLLLAELRRHDGWAAADRSTQCAAQRLSTRRLRLRSGAIPQPDGRFGDDAAVPAMT